MRVRQPKNKSEIHFTVYGDAIPKARARVVANKKNDKSAGTHAFTPKTTVEWEASVFGQSLASKPDVPWTGGVALGVLFFKKIPSGKRKKFDNSNGMLRPVGARDDYDNLIKAIKDALNGIYWLDDGQIVEYIQVEAEGKLLNPGKYYSHTPRVEILVRFLENIS
jgi:Holliday junction resolvase RusA-like endonuclease